MKSNAFYDAMKFVALVLLPASGSLYFGLAQIWHFPNPEAVVGSIVVVDTFLGVVLKLSSSVYYKSDAPYDGSMTVIPKPDGGQTFSLNLKDDPERLPKHRAVTFKVETPVDVDDRA